MRRVVVPETLDGLAAEDPAARRSRRDLRRVHRFMRTVPIVADFLRETRILTGRAPVRLLELGAGDGTLMLRVAEAIGRVGCAVELTLLDRLALTDAATIDGYARVGWQVKTITADVLAWGAPGAGETSSSAGVARWDLTTANLFLHHFEGSDLECVLQACAARSERVFACEPRRSGVALAAARLTGLIGANAVTRQDAVLSVHAGFRGDELTAMWGNGAGWALREFAAGPFSHCFDASRIGVR